MRTQTLAICIHLNDLVGQSGLFNIEQELSHTSMCAGIRVPFKKVDLLYCDPPMGALMPSHPSTNTQMEIQGRSGRSVTFQKSFHEGG